MNSPLSKYIASVNKMSLTTMFALVANLACWIVYMKRSAKLWAPYGQEGLFGGPGDYLTWELFILPFVETAIVINFLWIVILLFHRPFVWRSVALWTLVVIVWMLSIMYNRSRSYTGKEVASFDEIEEKGDRYLFLAFLDAPRQQRFHGAVWNAAFFTFAIVATNARSSLPLRRWLRHARLMLLPTFCSVLLTFEGCSTPDPAMHGIHTAPQMTTAAILQTRLSYDKTVVLRLTCLHAGGPTKVGVVRSSGLPLIDDCAAFNAERFWLLDQAEPVPTIREIRMKMHRNLSEMPQVPRV